MTTPRLRADSACAQPLRVEQRSCREIAHVRVAAVQRPPQRHCSPYRLQMRMQMQVRSAARLGQAGRKKTARQGVTELPCAEPSSRVVAPVALSEALPVAPPRWHRRKRPAHPGAALQRAATTYSASASRPPSPWRRLQRLLRRCVGAPLLLQRHERRLPQGPRHQHQLLSPSASARRGGARVSRSRLV